MGKKIFTISLSKMFFVDFFFRERINVNILSPVLTFVLGSLSIAIGLEIKKKNGWVWSNSPHWCTSGLETFSQF